jgi:soluble cytochrome b562
VSELYYAEMEAARNTAVDAYFEARPKLDYPIPREAFKAGFERGFKNLWDRQEEIRALADQVSAQYDEIHALAVDRGLVPDGGTEQ